LVLSPEILLADEPTGNLDAATSWEIVKLLSDINKRGTTVVMATHNLDVIKSLGKRVIRIEKGKIVEEGKSSGKHKDKKDHQEVEKEEPSSVKTSEGQEKE
jgi:cell division transport system ATP-binding protein